MKIKRYTADSMRVALAQVRAEQGPDAVILSTRRVEEGIEVIAAVDYDEALFVDATLRRAPAATFAPAEPAQLPREPAPAPAASGLAPSGRVASGPAASAFVPPPATFAPAEPVQLPREPAPAPAASGLAPSEFGASSLAPPAFAAATPAGSGLAVSGLAPSELAPSGLGASTLAPPAFAAAAPAGSGLAPSELAPSGLGASTLAPPAFAAAPEPRGPLADAARGRAADSGFLEMQRDLKNLTELMHDELEQMKGNERRPRDPLQARVLEQLTAMDMAPDIARALASLARTRTRSINEAHIPLALLVKHLQVVDGLGPVNSGVIALVGPTGAGKTTTIAKLAARWRMQHGCRDLALVSTDGYRVGAREQLMTYARILGVQLHTANTGAELKWVLERLEAKKLILIDTAGVGPRDVRLGEQLAALRLGAAGAQVFLTLPAHGEAHALDKIVRSFAAVAPGACILTKVDEAASLGAALSTALRHRLKVAYLCTGQRVPEDLHAAHERRVWLIRCALKLKEHAPPRVADNHFSPHLGRAHAHA